MGIYRLNLPVEMHIELTDSCNVNCFHCYNYWKHDDCKANKKCNNITEDQIGSILNKAIDSGVNKILFTGGEPFINRKTLYSGMEIVKNREDIVVCINSNGTLITEDDAIFFADRGINGFLISVMGSELIHDSISNVEGSFKKTINGIKLLKKHNIFVSTNMVVSKINKDYVYETAKYLDSLGVDVFCATPIVPPDRRSIDYMLTGEEVKNLLRTLLKIKKDFNYDDVDVLEPIARCLFTEEEDDEFTYFFGKRFCSAGITSCTVSSDGTIRPCTNSGDTYGNILSEDLKDIWGRMSFWASPQILEDSCKKCLANIICEGGCRVSSKIITGDIAGKDFYMKNPIDDLNRIKKIDAVIYKAITEDTTFIVNKKIKIRKEDFGYIIYYKSKILFVTDGGFDFLNKNILNKVSFKIKELFYDEKVDLVMLKSIIDNLLHHDILLIGG